MYSGNELQEILDIFLFNVVNNVIVEGEIVEFKQASNGFSSEDLGKYFSALSNEANIHEKSCGWLILGITNSGKIFGTNYLVNPHEQNKVKKELADNTPERFSIADIYEVTRNEKRILMIEIPPAPQGRPISFKGHYYGRDGESIVPLSPEKRKMIEHQIGVDWSAEIIPLAKIDDLDPKAIEFAKEKFKAKNPHLIDDISNWNTQTFLNKAKVTINNKITRTAIILLGKAESEHFLYPAQSSIKWILKTPDGDMRDYFEVTCPLLLRVNDIYGRIINLKYRYMQPGTLFPQEVDQYDPYVVREALHNAIAHQDYTKNGAISIVQKEDVLIFSNLGSFIPKSVERVILDDSPNTKIRNPYLARAMVNFMMVDTMGSGIRKMFTCQKNKYFPLPDFTITDERVEVSITGKVVDINYANLLARNVSLGLQEIMMLDKVQKNKTLTEAEIRDLRSKKLIEGRKPNFIISSSLAASTNQKVQHAKNAGLTTSSYETILLDSLKKFESLTRKEIDGILCDILPVGLSEQQKKTKANHLLTKLRTEGKIYNAGSVVAPSWKLVK